MPTAAVVIRNGVVAAIAGAGIAGVTSSSVKPRKVAVKYETDPDPVCLVVLGKDRPAGQTNMTRRVMFPVHVLLVRKGALRAAKSDDWMEEARGTLHDLLHRQLFLGEDGIVRRCEYDSDPPFDRGKFDENDDVGAQLFTYTAELASPEYGA